MARKTVKKIQINGISGGIVGSSVIDGRTTTNEEVAAYDDPLFTTACSPVLHAADLRIDVLDEGGQYAAIKALVGTTQNVTITSYYGDGSGDPTSSTSLVSMAYYLCFPYLSTRYPGINSINSAYIFREAHDRFSRNRPC